MRIYSPYQILLCDTDVRKLKSLCFCTNLSQASGVIIQHSARHRNQVASGCTHFCFPPVHVANSLRCVQFFTRLCTQLASAVGREYPVITSNYPPPLNSLLIELLLICQFIKGNGRSFWCSCSLGWNLLEHLHLRHATGAIIILLPQPKNIPKVMQYLIFTILLLSFVSFQ